MKFQKNNDNFSFDLKIFYLISIILFFWAFVIFYFSFRIEVRATKNIILIASFLFIALAAYFLSLPILLKVKFKALYNFPELFNEVKKEFSNWKTAKKEHYKAKTAIEQLHYSVKEDKDELINSKQEFIKFISEHQKLEKQLRLERQKNINLKSDLKEWKNRAIDFLDILERSLSHTELDESYKKATGKITKDFMKLINPLGIERIYAESGDIFDDKIHKVIGEKEDEDLKEGQILSTESWGYREGSEVIKKAEVVLVKKGTQKNNSNEKEDTKENEIIKEKQEATQEDDKKIENKRSKTELDNKSKNKENK